MPMKRAWSLNAAASEVIGKVEVFEPKIASLADHVLRARDHLFLDLAVLEHGLDDQIAIFQLDEIGRRRDARQHGLAIGDARRAAIDLIGEQLFRMRLALRRHLRILIDQHNLQAGERADIGDARAHEPCADHADRLQRLLRHLGRPAHAGIEILHGHKQRADHRRGLWRAQHMGEPARLDAQGRHPSAIAGPHRPPA